MQLLKQQQIGYRPPFATEKMPLMSSPLNSTSEPMASSASLRASTSMAANTSTGSAGYGGSGAPGGGSMAKYAKIQPAIAIKPKPAVQAPVQKPAFNPRYDPLASTSNLLHDEAMGNINTLRKWVLPPRPRPGRKPTGTASSPVSAVTDKSLCNKKLKMLKRDDPKAAMAASPVAGPGAGTPASSSSSASPGPIGIGLSTSSRIGAPTPQLLLKGENLVLTSGVSPSIVTSGTTFTTSGVSGGGSAAATSTLGPDSPANLSSAREGSDATIRPLNPARKQVSDLQTMYLARLKEQELIRNYIEVLTNQIKELKFVQSGVITFDALSSDGPGKPKLVLLLPSEQLDTINNVNDLDKFLAHLTTQSNVIHSVTKKFLGNSQNQESHLQLQIGYFLELRAKNNASAAVNQRNSPKQPLSLPVVSKTMSSFTPSLLRPLKMNLFDAEDEVIDVDILNEGDSLLPNSALADRLKLEESQLASSESDFLSFSGSPEQKVGQVLQKKSKKLGCGFCNNETPCVCFEADSIFAEPK